MEGEREQKEGQEYMKEDLGSRRSLKTKISS